MELLQALLENGNEEELHGFCRQWISEGIPHAFCGNPMLYEIARGWVARRLDIHAKEVTLIGSARIGYSLAPPPKLGQKFGSHSDLDLAVISADLFSRCDADFLRFEEDFKNGLIKPNSPRKERLWPEIVDDLSRTRRRPGFLDTWKIPLLDRYPLAKRIADTCWRLCEKLKATNENYAVTKASIRVYRDYSSFIRQTRVNLYAVSSIMT
ncbi:MAG: hypothetical protein NTV46_00905 [Verrucomicrobia bacterium]|nr:hypothetical protein [Verrucomicrobiota bacterium]